jgi:hypothetical protein
LLRTGLRYFLILAVAATTGYGIVYLRGSNLRSPRYVTRPDARMWWLGRLLNDSEWTPEGLAYRRTLIVWWTLTVVALISLMLVW